MKRLLVNSLLFLLSFAFISCEMNTSEPDLTKMEIDKSLAKISSGNVAINIVLNTPVTNKMLNSLNSFGKVIDILYEINAVRLLGKTDVMSSILALPFVKAANFDSERDAPPTDVVPVSNFLDGLSTWNLDAINVTDLGFDNRQVNYDGDGVIMFVIDTGLLDTWRQYFPEERIFTEYAKSFSGGGAAGINTSEQPNKWEHDQSSHGTHVTSTILGYNFLGNSINGVAPMVSVIPVKVLNQNGSGWSSVIARGILYAAELKESVFENIPVVINMSLGGSSPDAIEIAAIDYAVSKGIIVVASAGNRGTNGIGYPGAYEPVVSVASAGPKYASGSFGNPSWWFAIDVPEEVNSNIFYIPDYSGKALAGQDLDVTAPGDLIVGPYQVQSGKTSYYFLSGTSMACPHVSGIVALLLQKEPALTASEVEIKLENSAISLGYPQSAEGKGFLTADAVLN